MDNILRDLQNYSYPTKAQFNSNCCLIIHSKQLGPLFDILTVFIIKELGTIFFAQTSKATRSHFRANKYNTISSPVLFSVNSSIICSGLHF